MIKLNIVENGRKRLKITQERLAIKCNTRQSYISEIENYKRIPSKKLLLKLSKNLNLCPILILQECLCIDCKIKEGCGIGKIINKK
ncbi:helix-turn-helix domain-containing protein [Clostridium botulinum]|uniref:helix-turn-helix domain-containing protein n=1 Tax=Clostridium botulinum TaxID=1491 RepID=UPI000773070B|nr:helix-turn-helix transcriptional regulator [Clostridium botulinum]AUN08936.1 transcriptional regulator [Clostridium botulinum]